MELETLSCNNCGAPIDVPLTSSFVSCVFCSSRLAVKRTPTVHYTEVIERINQLDARTGNVEAEVRRMRLEKLIEELDNEWEELLETYSQKDVAGKLQPPSKSKANGYVALFSVVIPVSAILIFVLGANVFINALFPSFFVILLLAVGVGVVWFAREEYRKVDEYQRLESDYLSRRRALVNEKMQINMSEHEDQSQYVTITTHR